MSQVGFTTALMTSSPWAPVPYRSSFNGWDMGQTQNYNEKFLSGFRSELYQIGLPEGFQMAKEVMQFTIRATIRRDIGGDHQRISHVDSEYRQVGYKLLLAPMWISAFNFKQKTYRYVINGQNGRAHGERPYSWIKITAFVLTVLAVIGAGYVIFNQ
jgi:hypothetical protein